jgi:DNA repair protein RadC
MILKENTREKVSGAGDVAKVLTAILDTEGELDRDKEHFWALGLSVKNTIKFIDLVSLGTLSNSLVHPREVFRLAVSRGVASIIVGHNHPSGDTTPSREDIAVTEKLKSAGEILGIKLLDHVIIGEGGAWTSLLEKGYL